MAAVQMLLVSLDNGAMTVTLTYDDVTLAWTSVAIANNGTFPRAFTVTNGTKTWTFTFTPGQSLSRSVPKNVGALVFTSDPAETPPILSQSGFSLSVI